MEDPIPTPPPDDNFKPAGEGRIVRHQEGSVSVWRGYLRGRPALAVELQHVDAKAPLTFGLSLNGAAALAALLDEALSPPGPPHQ